MPGWGALRYEWQGRLTSPASISPEPSSSILSKSARSFRTFEPASAFEVSNSAFAKA